MEITYGNGGNDARKTCLRPKTRVLQHGEEPGMIPSNSKSVPPWLIYLVLALTTLAVYWPVGGFDFVNFDDPAYVSKNQHVLSGLTASNIKWAFTEFTSSNWHPMTWLSHMVDCEISQRPGIHHLINVLFHISNTLLLCALLLSLTGFPWRTAIVAALFAWHPLHVESVAWIAERKDLLSTFFGLLALLVYVNYVRSGKNIKYALTFLMYVLALMSKPMLVTLPLLMLLLDIWPLARISKEDNWKFQTKRLVIEKIPFFFLAIVSCAVTLAAQKIGGSVGTVQSFPIHLRAANAIVSYGAYLLKMIWPFGLSVFYPYRSEISPILLLSSLVLLSVITIWTLKVLRSKPYALVGWLWYLITLLPVIGLVQVGGQAMADRYSYIPSIGIFILLVWAIAEMMNRNFYRLILGTGTTAILIFFLAITSIQVQYWQNSQTLFQHAIDVCEANPLAHHNLAFDLSEREHYPQAIVHYERAIALQTNYPLAHLNLANALNFSGKMDEAMVHYRTAIEQQPDYPKAHYALAVTLQIQGKMPEAESEFREAIKFHPPYLEAHMALANLLLEQKRTTEALVSLMHAAQLAKASDNANSVVQLEKQIEAVKGKIPPGTNSEH